MVMYFLEWLTEGEQRKQQPRVASNSKPQTLNSFDILSQMLEKEEVVPEMGSTEEGELSSCPISQRIIDDSQQNSKAREKEHVNMVDVENEDT